MDRVQKLESGDFTTTTEGVADIQTPFYSGSFNLSYEIDSLNLITVGAGYTGTNLRSDSDFRISMASPMLEYTFGGNVFSRTVMNSVTANVDYQRTWASNPKRSLVLSYQFSGTPTDTYVKNTFDLPEMSDRRTDGFANSSSHTAQADFSTPLGSAAGHVLNAGAKFTARHNASDQSRSMADVAEGGQNYDFYNNIGALYVEYDGMFGPVGVKAGARYEHTWQDVVFAQNPEKDFSLNYGNLVPNASVQYNISMVQNIGLAYNMRISRPGITYLSPFVDDFSDPSAKSYGNPDLKPETGHNISLTYNFFSPKWIPGQKTRVILNGSAGYTDVRSKELDLKNSGWTYTSLLGFQQTLPWDPSLGIPPQKGRCLPFFPTFCVKVLISKALQRTS